MDIQTYTTFALTHRLGNPEIDLHLVIHNIGGRNARINKIDAVIERDGKMLTTLIANGFYQKINDATPMLLTPLSVKSGDTWSHTIKLFNHLIQSATAQYNGIQSAILKDIESKSKKNMVETNAASLDFEVLDKIYQFFDEHFIWKSGDYTVTIRVITEPQKYTAEKKYRFYLSDYQEEKLLEIKKHYKYGGGIIYDKKLNSTIFVDLYSIKQD